MRILITGICGFVGSTLAKAWLAAEERLEIIGLDSLIRLGSEQNRAALLKLGIEVRHCDIRSASDFEGLPPVDWVVDAAANPSVLAGIDGQGSSRQLMEHNLFGTVNILEYCKRHRSGFILLSTSRVYSIEQLAGVGVESRGEAFVLSPGQTLPPGLTAEGIGETFSTDPPISLYGSAKLASEVLALEYGETFGFPVWINRCGVLAGAGQFGRTDQGIFAFWINAWLRRHPLTYIGYGGSGHQVRDCLHPRDLVSLLKKQTHHRGPVHDRIFNIGGGTSHAMSLAELSAWCASRFGPHTVRAGGENRQFDVPWLVMDATLARKGWDWQPQTPREAILEEISLHAERHPDWLGSSGAL